MPVGSNQPISVDVRVVAATHRALRQEAREGRFREDLMYRLRVVPIYLPPLRQRPSDIEILFWHFVELGNLRGPRHVSSIAPNAMKSMLLHSWPGNVRELRNVVEYAFAVGRGESIEQNQLPPEFCEESPSSGKARVDFLTMSVNWQTMRVLLFAIHWLGTTGISEKQHKR